MISYIRLKIKKTFYINNLIVYIKFLLGLGLETEAKFIKKQYKFGTSVDIGSKHWTFYKYVK